MKAEPVLKTQVAVRCLEARIMCEEMRRVNAAMRVAARILRERTEAQQVWLQEYSSGQPKSRGLLGHIDPLPPPPALCSGAEGDK
jgi:hypothetical protein